MTDIRYEWNKTREGRWGVADACYEAKKRGEDMELFGKSVTPPFSRATGYRYARAGECYDKLFAIYGEPVSRMRLILFETYFERVADLPESEAVEWLMDACDTLPTIEEFTTNVNEVHAPAHDWQKELRNIERRYIHFPAIGIDQAQVRRIQRAAKLLHARIASAVGGLESGNGGDK